MHCSTANSGSVPNMLGFNASAACKTEPIHLGIPALAILVQQNPTLNGCIDSWWWWCNSGLCGFVVEELLVLFNVSFEVLLMCYAGPATVNGACVSIIGMLASYVIAQVLAVVVAPGAFSAGMLLPSFLDVPALKLLSGDNNSTTIMS